MSMGASGVPVVVGRRGCVPGVLLGDGDERGEGGSSSGSGGMGSDFIIVKSLAPGTGGWVLSFAVPGVLAVVAVIGTMMDAIVGVDWCSCAFLAAWSGVSSIVWDSGVWSVCCVFSVGGVLTGSFSFVLFRFCVRNDRDINGSRGEVCGEWGGGHLRGGGDPSACVRCRFESVGGGSLWSFLVSVVA